MVEDKLTQSQIVDIIVWSTNLNVMGFVSCGKGWASLRYTPNVYVVNNSHTLANIGRKQHSAYSIYDSSFAVRTANTMLSAAAARRTSTAVRTVAPATAVAASSRRSQRLGSRPVSTTPSRRCSASRLLIPTRYPFLKLAGGKRTLTQAAPLLHSELVSSSTAIQDGRKLRVRWTDGREGSYHAVWLRHNCRCPSCTSQTNQRLLRRKDLEGEIRITSSSVAAAGSIHIYIYICIPWM